MTPSSKTVEAPDVTAVLARLRSGEIFTALVFDSANERAIALERVLREMGLESTRTVWVGNPLRSPLTIERFLLQIVGPEIDLRIDRTPTDLADLLADVAGAKARLLVIVQQPETINPETTELLGEMAAHLAGRAAQVQFLFAGSPALRLPKIGLSQPATPSPSPEPTPKPVHVPTNMSVGGRRDMLPVAALVSIATLGILLSAWPSTKNPRPDPVPVRLQLEAISTTLSNGMLSSMSRMREEYDRLLADHTATLPPLTEVQKDELFQEFVARYRGG